VSVGSERVSMELIGPATRLRRGYGAAGIEGKAVRVAASERSRGDASDVDGQTERSKWAGAHESIGRRASFNLHFDSDIPFSKAEAAGMFDCCVRRRRR
jgi:hypothetical protein